MHLRSRSHQPFDESLEGALVFQADRAIRDELHGVGHLGGYRIEESLDRRHDGFDEKVVALSQHARGEIARSECADGDDGRYRRQDEDAQEQRQQPCDRPARPRYRTSLRNQHSVSNLTGTQSKSRSMRPECGSGP